ncbi:helicase and polymerase-containing protein TEBICHI-like [Prunus dulcis]|uniref:helicase and polymerase-containing protein TEBICHI-like n=1 Tax=Prunus dulcis TaxID=3755 RepID=UPI0014822DEE|nr:helicase and polymerase-containing protein TEBICHI-like [Prunus dulcis]
MLTTNMKVDLTGKDMTSYSPVDEVAKLTGNHESNEACTPSSFVPLKDHLDLNSWQQPEICSLYRKKGISKLYPWQVDYLQVEVCIADKESCILRINKVGNPSRGYDKTSLRSW